MQKWQQNTFECTIKFIVLENNGFRSTFCSVSSIDLWRHGNSKAAVKWQIKKRETLSFFLFCDCNYIDVSDTICFFLSELEYFLDMEHVKFSLVGFR